jgi:glutamate/tyrosine decarboxylase-like PLP-dependent enzyme
MTNPEETLDPQDWPAMRRLGHQMIDDMFTYLETQREHAPWQPIPPEVKEFLQQPAPQAGRDPAEIYAAFQQYILPYPLGNIHPRFWGWVIGTGTPFGVLAEMLAATMNPNVGGGEHIATYVELQVLDWCKQMLNYPAEASGILVSGGSMANLVGLAVGRNLKAGADIRRKGLQTGKAPLTVYGSEQMHSSIQKAVELMGLGSQYLRFIPTDAQYRIDLNALQKSIAADRVEGLIPICVVGNAGTVNTGAIDDLNGLADICARENLWFHVDGAFGGLAALSPRMRPALNGMERADSLAFDLHKWMYMPMEIGCTLVRDPQAHLRTFSLTPDYLAHSDRGAMGAAHWFSDYGLQLTRNFRSLKAWMSILEHGTEKYGRMIQQNIDQAAYLAELVDAHPNLERLAPVPLNIVCYRYTTPGLDEAALDRLNRELLIRLHETGVGVPSYTILSGKYAIRVANVNQRSRREDFNLLVRESVRLGNELAARPV